MMPRDTPLDNTTNECLGSGCSGDVEEDPKTIRLAGIMDYPWAPDIFNVTVQLINEGFWPGTLKEGEILEHEFINDNCDEALAVRAYGDLLTRHNNVPPHGIVGSRCSGASINLALVSGLEGVPQLSPASNAARLTDDINFPFFSRLVAPNNEDGEVAALASVLRELGWKRVTVIATNKVFANEAANEFQKFWKADGTGVISDFETIRMNYDGDVDLDSASEALGGIQVDQRSGNSRIIFLAAHHQHAFKILQHANEIGFLPDSIWVGLSSWVGRSSPDADFSWLPDTPGYLGVSPLPNRDIVYQRFLERLRDWEFSNGKPKTDELPMFAAETVDSIVALAKAISDNGIAGRRDGRGIVDRLRQADFDGVSGRVQLTDEGDRKNPEYAILHAPRGVSGEDVFAEVGSAGINGGPVTFSKELCFPKLGCVNWQNAPSDIYPTKLLPRWALILIVLLPGVLVLVNFGFLLKLWRRGKGKEKIRKELEVLRDVIVCVRVAEHDYTPIITQKQDGDIEEGVSPAIATEAPRGQTEGQGTAVWCWKESRHCMDTHSSNCIFGDPKFCWIKYGESDARALEAAYRQNQPSVWISPWLVVDLTDFNSMKQTKTTTGFVRPVQRQEVQRRVPQRDPGERRRKLFDLGVRNGDELPDDLQGEPCMVLVKGDLVQVSTEREDGWALGTKLYHADEARARELSEIANCDGDDKDTTILADKGWFQINVTREPLADDLSQFRKNVGNPRALDPPRTWDPVIDPTRFQKHELQQDNEERDAVERAFMKTVRPPMFGNVNIIKVERVQNLALWQSFAVKRQTICYRQTARQTGQVVAANDETQQRKAMERFERRWLWHGSDVDSIDKILQQGFNRSFCKEGATVHGKGVYFARDAEYSAHPRYAPCDDNCNQHILACRVVVGEFCRGERDALIPDVRDSTNHTLFDTTVDVVSDPSVYVTYHDAQAYPEFLITFQAEHNKRDSVRRFVQPRAP